MTRDEVWQSAAPLLRQMVLERRARLAAAAKSVPEEAVQPATRAVVSGRSAKDAA